MIKSRIAAKSGKKLNTGSEKNDETVLLVIPFIAVIVQTSYFLTAKNIRVMIKLCNFLLFSVFVSSASLSKLSKRSAVQAPSPPSGLRSFLNRPTSSSSCFELLSTSVSADPSRSMSIDVLWLHLLAGGSTGPVSFSLKKHLFHLG